MSETPETGVLGAASEFGARTVVGHVDVDTLTPRAVKRMLTAAESGDLGAQAELFERMEEKDGELDAYLRTRKAGAAHLHYDIRPSDRSPQAKRAAELCRRVLEAIEGLPQALFDLLDAVPKGFSAVEIDWRTDRDDWMPARLLWRPQRWFALAGDGETLLLRGDAPGEERELNPLNWIVHRVKARSGFCGRSGLLRSCVRAFIVRHFAWKDWMAFAEVYGMPPRIGWLRPEVAWDSEEARQLFRAVRSLGMDAAAVVREGNRIEMLDTRTGNEGQVFDRLIERAGRELTLAVLGQLLSTGGEGGGSYALGQVHNQVRWDLVESDARALERTLTRRLLGPIVRLNLGDGHPVPLWHFDTEKPEDLARLAQTVRTLGEAGLPIPADWAYGKFGIPKPAEGEPVFGGKEGCDDDRR